MLVQKNIVDEIITGNCKDILSKVPSNSIQLTITSRLIEMLLIMICMPPEMKEIIVTEPNS